MDDGDEKKNRPKGQTKGERGWITKEFLFSEYFAIKCEVYHTIWFQILLRSIGPVRRQML